MSAKNLRLFGVGLALAAALVLSPAAAQAANRGSSLRAPAHASATARFNSFWSFLAGIFSAGTMNPDGSH